MYLYIKQLDTSVKRFQAFPAFIPPRNDHLVKSSRPCIYRRFIGQYSGNKLPERDGICQTASPQFWGSARSKYQILEEFHKAVDQLPHEKGFSPIDLEKASQESKPRNLPTSKEERAQRLTERRACMRVCKDGVVSVT